MKTAFLHGVFIKIKFEIKDSAEIKNYLRINIQRDSNGNFLINQRKEIENLLGKISGKNYKQTYNPMATSLSKNVDSTDNIEDNSVYKQAVGALLYISTVSRLDVSLTANKLNEKKKGKTNGKGLDRIGETDHEHNQGL
ncbi:hypothetical protein NPIL_688551 [Nephila pilipes]|uniref:Reverse transcriptase Ty1/copia-type domain-containing protein n=1 Tax=Nephila pilipes TaxID=299642 RepID=A0A8X6U4X9_NEPPI|nr:hypothetical protein NPIL_688551 [Nephila pilipes]